MSAKEYIRTAEMMGTKPFRCYNCNSLMIRHFVSTTFDIGLTCRICKVIIYMRCKESIPAANEMKDEFVKMSKQADILQLEASLGKPGTLL